MLYLDSNAHSVFALHYHLIMTTKYRRRVFNDVISDRAKEIFLHIARSYNISLQEWNHDVDHIHILFSAHPNSCLTKFINAYKSASSRLLKKEFPEIREKLWKEAFWSQSFCLISTGAVSYTHLDVYKRQISGSKITGNHNPCTDCDTVEKADHQKDEISR